MRILQRIEVAYILREALKQAELSQCKRNRQGVVILDQAGKIVISRASRVLLSGRGLKLCRGECVHEHKPSICGSLHPIQHAILQALSNGYGLKSAIICSVYIKDDKLFIPERVDCCSRCEELIISMGMETILWNSSSKEVGCFGVTADELQKGICERIPHVLPQGFPLATFEQRYLS
jgi:deoxycytidylate deaminase